MNKCSLIDKFFYVCGKNAAEGRNIHTNDNIKIIYNKYFKEIVIDASWVPRDICNVCRIHLLDWESKKIKEMPFDVPMKWSPNSDNIGRHDANNCYGCKNYSKKIYLKKRICECSECSIAETT